jgi:hypothetical protein
VQTAAGVLKHGSARHCETPGTTRTTRTTTRTAQRPGCSWSRRCAYSWRRPAPSGCGGLLQRLVGRFEGAPPQRASTQGLAWPRDPIGCRPQEPSIPATATAVRPIPPWPLSARCSLPAARCPRCCPFSHACRQAALRSQNYKPCPVPVRLLLLCSCSLLRLWPPANPQPRAFYPSLFAFRPSPFALRLAPCATLPLRPLPSTLLRCRPCPFQPAPLLKH